ncbi:MAG: DUF6691 family protein [Candidatus Puniceispirillaceae bacterium]
MTRLLSAVFIGAVFGVGLALAGMLNPVKVQGFLDITGLWDPSLAFVMVGGIGVTLIGFPLVLKQARPRFADMFHLPDAKHIDRRLIIGSALFGVGWGIGGLCPGPALASLSFLSGDILLFVVMMLVGLAIGRRVKI